MKHEQERQERERQRQHEIELEQTKLEQQKFICEQNIMVQREIAHAQQIQREQEAIARD